MSPAAQVKGKYGSAQMTKLKGLEAVRKRPGMYIGNTGLDGLHHLIHEILDNAVDEAMAGHCSRIGVTMHADGSVTVADDGRGVPVDRHPTEKMTGVEMAFGELHAGGKFGDAGYKVSGGLHGVGAAVVNALSAWCEVEVTRDGGLHRMRWERGKATGPLVRVKAARGHGTRVRFLPDASIFPETTFDPTRVRGRLEELSYLNPGLTLVLETPAGREEFLAKGGTEAWVRALVPGATARDVIHVQETSEDESLHLDVAIAYRPQDGELVASFVNSVRTPDGGTHETGVRTAWSRVLSWALQEFGTKAQQKLGFKGEDVREGFVCVLAAKLVDPQFEGQTKQKLGSAIAGPAQSLVQESLRAALAKSPTTARRILERVLEAAALREASARTRKQEREQRSLLDVGVLPGKLADCVRSDRDSTELFIVEGDSAGGSAKQGRDRQTQAILPLRGKILNTDGLRRSQLLESTEIQAIVTALGLSLDPAQCLDRLRYGKVIIMTDADDDGSHIATLLLTLFFRHFRPLITHGHLWLAQPPLYRVLRGDVATYCHTAADRDAAQAAQGGSVTRFKGLGEMAAVELWATTMDPNRRRLVQVTVEDEAMAEAAFTTMMGDNVEARRQWLGVQADRARARQDEAAA